MNAHTQRQQALFDILKQYISSEVPNGRFALWRDIRSLNAAELVETLATVQETERMIKRMEKRSR